VKKILTIGLIVAILGVGASRIDFSKLADNIATVFPVVVAMLTNSARASQNLGALKDNALLDKAAQAKANDMAAKGYFAHVSPDGSQPWDWVRRAGYNYLYAGENLAVNFDDSNQVVNAWLASPTHRFNILRPQYTDIGIATSTGIYKGRQAVFVVEEFASPAK
jgi:uncharacterized protein YkwD